jgi:hypothetical protein
MAKVPKGSRHEFEMAKVSLAGCLQVAGRAESVSLVLQKLQNKLFLTPIYPQ